MFTSFFEVVLRRTQLEIVSVVTQFLLSACCLIRNKITADPGRSLGDGRSFLASPRGNDLNAAP